MPFGKINGMKLNLDKSGRLVLPKSLRQRMGLRAGATLEVIQGVDGLLLRPIAQRPSLVESNGFLVHTGQATEGFDWQRLTEDLEWERTLEIIGPRQKVDEEG
jgi:AbrB family looped-hinge helix DNA binding protein